MCGITALLGKPCINTLLDSLKQLQNRGYDSAGICCINNNQYLIKKYASTTDSAIDRLEKEIQKEWKDSVNGIAHTRWATHGAKTDTNSHPHQSFDHKFALVHNGIIENFSVIKDRLESEHGIPFKSETDTEVIVNLLAFEYARLDTDEEQRIFVALKKTVQQLEGTWGLAIQCIDAPNQLFCVRKGSPLLIGMSDSWAMVTSEQSGFCKQVNNYIAIDNHDICILTHENGQINLASKQLYDHKELTDQLSSLTPAPYPHWTLKEIYEQYDSSLRAISHGGRLLSSNEVKLGGLSSNKKELGSIDNLILLGCGTSYFAGQVGITYFKELCHFNTVQLFDGAEFSHLDIPKAGITGCILMSQSGETKDLHRCIQIGRQHNLILIGLVNVPDSMIAREVDCGCYLNAGREVAVASTKSFTSQVILLSMMAIWFSQMRDENAGKRIQMIYDLRKLHIDMKETIRRSNDRIKDILPIFHEKQNCFLLGKGRGEAIAKEGALKIKEISYIHAEGYSASSLKHGPFALLEKDYPVVMIATKSPYSAKLENCYQQVLSRHAKIVLITDDADTSTENSIVLPENRTFSELLSIIPIQFLAYELSVSRGINPDMPKNLAKVVTVE